MQEEPWAAALHRALDEQNAMQRGELAAVRNSLRQFNERRTEQEIALRQQAARLTATMERLAALEGELLAALREDLEARRRHWWQVWKH